MSNWFYYNEQGEKISTTGGQLKGLAKAGLITSETVVETEGGKKAPARKVKGLTFLSLETAQPAGSEIYGVATLPPEPSPFTAPLLETANPSNAPKPVVTKLTDSPFTATMPTVNPAMSQSVPVPVDEDEEFRNPRNPILTFIGVGIMLFGFVLIGIGISKFGGGGTYEMKQPNPLVVAQKQNSVDSNAFAVPQRVAQAMAAVKDFNNAFERGNESAMETAILEFGSEVSGCSPEFQAAHKELFEAMTFVMVARTKSFGDRDSDMKFIEKQAQAYIDSMDRYMEASKRERARLQSGGR